ncbi:MAG: hypothetical protein LUG95_02665 [Clostridiales bacterium]|nr:hypothetical protein [Clostridiales bacterium]
MGKKVTIAIFCIILSVFTAVSALKPNTEISARERRVLETMPDINSYDIMDGTFQETFENYVNDQFFLRNSWVDFATQMQILIGKKDINGVYIGEDDYLIEKYTDEDFDEEIVENNIYVLADFLNEMTDTYGKETVDFLTVPAKACVLTDYLPENAYSYPEEEITNAICDLLNEPEIHTDFTETLSEHQDEYIYYRTDHHWTTLGAYYAYAEFADKKGYEVQPLNAFEKEMVSDSFYGTTYNKLSLSVESDTVEIYHSEAENGITVDQNDGEIVSDSFYFSDMVEDEDYYQVFFGGNTEKIVITTSANRDGLCCY